MKSRTYSKFFQSTVGSIIFCSVLLTLTGIPSCDDACDYTNDNQCDEPEGTDLCPEGTDVNDCENPNTCTWALDGECDEPEGTGLCEDGTDFTDCAEAAANCVAADESCQEQVCCDGAICVNDTSLGLVTTCADECTENSQCVSGCCADLSDGGKICASSSLCKVGKLSKPMGTYDPFQKEWSSRRK